VDAAAVCTALVGLSQAQDTKPLVVDTQPLLFAQLSHDDLNKAASAAEEGSLLHEALVLITKAREDHVVSEDSDKAPEFFAPTTLIANLFNAFAETDKQSYVVDLTTKRTAAFDAATAAFEEASAHVDEAQASVTSAVETHELKLEEHRVLMEQWDEGDDTDDGPGPGPDYELVVTAIDALNSAKDGRTAARRAVATAQKQRAAPAECAKTYLLAEDFFTGCDGQEVTADNQVARLAALAFAGLPVRAVVNVARQRVVRVEDENSNDAGDETAQGEAPLTGLTQAVPEDDDEFPPITAALMVAHETCVTKFNDFDAPAFRLASAPLAFVRSESGVVPDAPFLAKLLAVKCGVLCLASAEYQNWSDTSDIVRVPDYFVKSVTAELRSDAKEDPTDEEAGEETTDSDVLNAAEKIITQTPKPKNQMDLVEHRVYDHALAGVPHTRVSVAVVLDAMLREVCASACDPEDVTAASDAAAAAAAALFVTAALAMTKQSQIPSHVTNAFATTTSRSQFGFGTSNLGDTVSSSVFGGYDTHPDPGGTFRELPSTFQSGTNVNGKSFKPGTSKGFDPLFPDEGNDGDEDDESYPMDNQSRGVTLVPHGDAANVLRSRYAAGGVGVSSTGNCSGLVTRSDPDAVELRMSSLLFAPGIHRNGMPDEPTLDDDQRGARKTALASFLGKPGGDPEYGSFHGSSVQQKPVSFGSHNHVDLHLHDPKISLAHAERRELMQRVADETLPLGVFSDHGDEVRHRRLWEPLTRAAYANSINAALSSFGTQNVTSKYFAPEDALLVTCHAAPHFEQMCDYSVNPATPWSEFFGAWENGFETVLETRVARDLKLAKQQKQFQDEDERRLETEESELNALPDDLREAELLKMEADKKLAEEARRAAEDEEAADWVWDGDASDDDDATPDDTEIDDSKDTDLDGRKWVTDPSNKKTVRRVRTAVVRLPRVSYAVLKEVGTCRGETNRLFPALAESVVAVSPDGGIDVVVAGVRLGLRTVTTRPHLPAGSHPGHKEHRIVLSLVDRPGACVVVGLAPADSKPAPVEKEEGEEDEGTEKVAPEETTEGDAEKEEETPAEPPAPKKNPVFVQYTCESGLCVSVTSDRVVCQTRADANANANATGSGNVPSSLKKSLAAHETCRAILPNGTTVTHSAFGTTILGVDGNTSTRASDTYSWIGTNSRGIRWEQADSFVFQPPPAPEEGATETEPVEGDTHAEEFDPDQTPTPTRGDIITPYPTFVVPVEQATVIDPETRAVVTSRADLTLVVAHPEFEDNASHKGSKGDSKQDDSAPNRNTKTLVVHADGTRVCRDVRAGCDWRVEKDGFAPTQSSSDTNTIDVDLGDAVASVDYDGVCSLNLGAYGALCVDVSGLVVFVAGNGVGLDATSAARRALIAATTPEGELAQCASSTIDYGDPDMDNAFVFDLGRGAVRFVDHAARRAEIGIGDGPRGRKAVASEASAAVFELGPSISEARLGEDGVDGETTPHAAATPAQFVVTAKGGFRGACAFHELDPRSPPTPTPEAGGGEGHREETDAVASEPPASEKPAAEVPPSPAKSQVAPEPSGTTSTTVVGEHSQLSIFTPMTPAAPIKASLVSPRVFVAYPDQDEYFEVLSFASFAKYRYVQGLSQIQTLFTAPA
jgi:CRISPR-associated protein Cas5t